MKLDEKLGTILEAGRSQISILTDAQMGHKPTENKWSKKEILGHIIDSALYNLIRFAEIQFSDKPYQITGYQQDVLVKVNDYQNANPTDLLNLWFGLNHQIWRIVNLSEKQLTKEVVLDSGKTVDFRFLVEDYIEHLQHHLHQIEEH